MRKSTFIILAFFTIIFVASCKKEVGYETECATTKLNGTIKKEGGNNYMYGTHTFVENNGTIYALTSQKENLDKYLDRHVEIKVRKIKGYSLSGGPEHLEVSKVK